MMSKERELLERVLESRTFMQGVALRREIEELLAQPKQETITPRQGLEEYKRGYEKAELDLKREPLGVEEINECMETSDSFGFNGDVYIADAVNAFENFARAIEKHTV